MNHMHFLTVFVAVGQARSFAEAANRLALSPASITRAISGLENYLGVELLQRTTRNVRLTEAGARYFIDVREIVAKIADVDDAAAASPRGKLIVAATDSFGNFFVMPHIAEYLEDYPHVEVAANFSDRSPELLFPAPDVAVCIGAQTCPNFDAIQVGEIRSVFCATPAYLEWAGVPRDRSDLNQHTVIEVGEQLRLSGKGLEGDRPRRRLAVMNHDTALAAAECGIGIARVLSYQVAAHLADGRVALVLCQNDTVAQPVHVLRRKSKAGAPKVRIFADTLIERLRSDPNLHDAWRDSADRSPGISWEEPGRLTA